ncbi:MAG: hypothetical protein AB1345_12375 [Chloroflexota bacterium]
MSSIFDKLQSEIEDRRKDEGISALDLIELPPPLRRLMRLMLREVEMTYAELRKAAEEMPEEDGLIGGKLDQALATLSKQNWLIRRGEGEFVTYKVNLRRKRGSKFAQSIWSSLEDKIGQRKDPSVEGDIEPTS